MTRNLSAFFGKRLIRTVCWVIVLGGAAALFPVQRGIDQRQGELPEAGEVLYLPSGVALRRLSLGHEGLLADIYWTRVVQYFGRKRLARSTEFELLGPLLRIATELDPHLLIAYRFGSIFLAEKPPGGAGHPEEALQLLRRGIVANPDYWRLWEDLGFIYYWDLKDYAGAARVFQAGSEQPGAMVWMKVLAAKVAGEGGELQTSQALWSEIYRHADNDQIRQSALEHLVALETQDQIEKLNKVLAQYAAKEGRVPHSFQELVASGYLSQVPSDPSNVPYRVGPKGRAVLSPQSKVDMRLLQ
jgi:tetratricopeptide (TPR) repeat protein